MIEQRPGSPRETSSSRFLHLCLRGRWDNTALEVAETIAAQSNFDWIALEGAIEAEGLAPLLHTILRGKNLLPPALEASLSLSYHRNACRNMLLFHHLTEVLQHLETAGVPAIVLKGAALAERVYGDIAVRPMSDLDLLVQPQRVAITRQTLGAIGYILSGIEMQRGYTEEFRSEETWTKKGLVDIHIDLHWRLISPLYYQHTLSTDWFWETALPVKINGANALVLGWEAQLLHLCAHLLLHHGGQGWLWGHDIAEVIHRQQTQLNWQQLLDRAQTCNLLLSLQQVLTHVAANWKVPIPTAILEQLHTLTPSPTEQRILTWIQAKHLTASLRSFLVDLIGAPTWKQRLRFAWNTLFPTRAYMQHRYSISTPRLTLLYYPYRWLRGLRRLPST